MKIIPFRLPKGGLTVSFFLSRKSVGKTSDDNTSTPMFQCLEGGGVIIPVTCATY